MQARRAAGNPPRLQPNRHLPIQNDNDIPGIQRSYAFDEEDILSRMNVRPPIGNHLAENDHAIPGIQRSYAFDEEDLLSRMNVRPPFGNHLAENDHAIPGIQRSISFDEELPRMHQRPRSNAFDEQDAPPPRMNRRPRSNAFDEGEANVGSSATSHQQRIDDDIVMKVEESEPFSKRPKH